MNTSLSVYLDLLRFSAAVLVYFYHIGFYSGARLPSVGNLGSEAVLIFFVLSGFVIAYSSSRKHTELRDFVVARLSRLWSVAVPALLVTFILDNVGQRIDLEVYSPLQPYSIFKWTASILVNLFFINQVWDLKIWPGTNGPFWSISYEFWFYTLFSTLFFLNGARRFFAFTICLIIAGPKILITFPVWFMGVFAYRAIQFQNNDQRFLFGWTAWLCSILLIWMYFAFDGALYLQDKFPLVMLTSTDQWRVNFWPESYTLGCIVALNIYGFGVMGQAKLSFLVKHAKSIRKVADTSFGIYLFHFPAILFFKAVLRPLTIEYEFAYVILLYILPFVFSISCSIFCEKYKYLFRLMLNNIGKPARG